MNAVRTALAPAHRAVRRLDAHVNAAIVAVLENQRFHVFDGDVVEDALLFNRLRYFDGGT